MPQPRLDRNKRHRMSVTSSQIPCQQCGAPVSIDATHCAVCGAEQVGDTRPPEEWIGELVDQKYRIESILGVGGMGMVFRAHRVFVGDKVALKVLFPRLLRSPLQRRLFRDEAIAAARLSHPNVVTVYDADLAEDGTAYIAMELLEGQTLKALMKAEAPMKPERLIALAAQICDGLEAAHQARIVHRDLKPDNIFLVERGAWPPRIKLVDFGIAAMVDVARSDEQNQMLGTLRYMSPEQCRGETLDARADLYSIGVVLYEGLTRRRATGKSRSEVLRGVVKPPNTVLSKNDALPLELEDLIMCLLSKRREDRPETAGALRAALTGLMDNAVASPTPAREAAVQAHPPTTPLDMRLRFWVFALAGLGGIMGGLLWEYFRR